MGMCNVHRLMNDQYLDFELILLVPWGIDLIPGLLSLRGRLWITPRELQLHSLHWTSCLLRGVDYYSV